MKVVGKKHKVSGDRKATRPVVCLLGKTAALLLGNEFAKPQHRGTIIQKPGGWRFAPLYHPAAALYDGQLFSVMVQQMKAIFDEEVKVKK